MPAVIRAMRPSDADSVLRIQDEGIETGLASFSGTAGDWESFNAPEYLQGRMKANAILPPLVRLLTCETARRAQREALSAVAKRLLGAGRGGAAPDSTPAMRAARHVLQVVGEGRRCPP